MDNSSIHPALALLLLASLIGTADAQNNQPSQSKSFDPLSEAVDAFGRLMASPIHERVKQERIERQPHIGNTLIKRSARECMKPGNVIDDEVLRCMRGE